MEYITQKDILKELAKEDIEELIFYISFAGNYDVSGYHMTSRNFEIIEPIEIKIRKNSNSPFRINVRDFIDEVPEPGMHSLSKFFSRNSDDSPLYPLDHEVVDNFTYEVEVESNIEDLNLDDDILDSIKFFKTMKEAEMNFIIMLKNYLDNMKLTKAVSVYNKILDKYEDLDPAILLKNL